MNSFVRSGVALATLLFVAGCGILEPELPEANPSIAVEWPLPPTAPDAEKIADDAEPSAATNVDAIGWHDFFTDSRLEELIGLALDNNRDLRVAVLNGRLKGNLNVSKVDRDIALVAYERSIQAGFGEVADALALTHTLSQERASREALVAAATRADELSRVRYEAGSDSYLVLLDSQRTLYDSQQALVATELEEQANRITLYKVLGGGWH